jgi:hypothetical protein
MSLRPDLNNTYRDALGQAASHREPAPYVAPTRIDPRTSIGAGDRAIADARQRILDPFNLRQRPDNTAAPAKPKRAENWSALGASYAAARARADSQARAQQVAAEQEAERIRRAHTLIPKIPKDVREAYERQQLANELGED